MTKIKICGLKRKEDMEYVNICLPDYIGFVFAESKRRVTSEKAKELKGYLDKRIIAAGVFVNADIDEIIEICKNGTIDIIQLHGDEDANYIQKLKAKTSKPVIKAVSVSDGFTIPELTADYFLFDTFSKSLRGGTGKIFNWDIIKGFTKPYFLAGGLNADNIPEAISRLNPFCLDVSGGAETNGVKDLNKIKKIINITRGVMA